MGQSDIPADFLTRLNQANGRLKSANVGVKIEHSGKRLYLRATLPPKPGSDKDAPYQQRIALGIHFNPKGISLAESEARLVGAKVDAGEFDWSPYIKQESQTAETVRAWVERLEDAYFTQRKRTPKSQTTWDGDYWEIYRRMPQDAPLTLELLRNIILAIEPDTRTRKRAVLAVSKLAEFSGIQADFKGLEGNYSPRRAEPREVPDDRLVAEIFHKLPDDPWRWAYGVMAVWGLRNHEIFYLDLSKFPVALVADGKTGKRRVWPLFPEWAKEWRLVSGSPPQCTAKNNSDLGSRVTKAFKRLQVPFSPYNLRHAWAVRSLEFGLDISLAAAQMGHSVQVHSEIYHHWITEETHQRAYDALLNRSDRPRPPQI